MVQTFRANLGGEIIVKILSRATPCAVSRLIGPQFSDGSVGMGLRGPEPQDDIE